MTTREGVQGAFRVTNPDNTSTLIQTGETRWCGGRIFHLGRAGVDWGSLDPSIKNPFQQEQRQRESVQAMADAFHSTVAKKSSRHNLSMRQHYNLK
jgi:protein gp37